MASNCVTKEFTAGELAKKMTMNIKVTGYDRFRLRLQLAKPIFWLGCKVAGVGLKMDLPENDG